MKHQTRGYRMPVVAGVLWGAAALNLAAGSSANALTLINRDNTGYDIAITENDATMRVPVLADQTLEAICPNGCTISLQNGSEQVFNGTEIVLIENGTLSVSQ